MLCCVVLFVTEVQLCVVLKILCDRCLQLKEKLKLEGQGKLVVSLGWKDKGRGIVQTEIVPFRSDGMLASYAIGHTVGVTRHTFDATPRGSKRDVQQAWNVELDKVCTL